MQPQLLTVTHLEQSNLSLNIFSLFVMQGRFTFDNALRNFGSLECTILQCIVSSTKDHSSSAAVINMHSAETTMRITVIHIIIYTVAAPLALPCFYWFSVKD